MRLIAKIKRYMAEIAVAAGVLVSMPFIMGVKRDIMEGKIEPDELGARGEELVLWLVFVVVTKHFGH